MPNGLRQTTLEYPFRIAGAVNLDRYDAAGLRITQTTDQNVKITFQYSRRRKGVSEEKGSGTFVLRLE